MGVPLLLVVVFKDIKKDEKIVEIEWITLEKVTYFSVVWLLGFMVALARGNSTRNNQSFRISFSSSAYIGFLSLGVAAYRIGDSSDGIDGVGSGIFLSILIGASGPFHELIIETALKKFGLIDDKTNSREIEDGNTDNDTSVDGPSN